MLHLSNAEGTGGTIKSNPSDFIVKEITGRGKVLEPGRQYACMDLEEEQASEGKFTTFVLQKTNWNTVQALVSIAKVLGRGKKSIGYAGTKDRTSVSVQLASIYGAEPERLLALHLKDISINGAWKSNGVELGSNLGNAFDIVIESVKSIGNAETAIASLNGRFPNYFDRQRFGSRLNNARVGISIMRGDFEAAVFAILTDASGETNKGAVEARERLSNEKDFKAALSYFPRYLKNESYMMNYLAYHENDYAGALRRIPRGISMMFIHAVQSLVFNLGVEERIRNGNFNSGIWCRSNSYGFPDLENVTVDSTCFPVIPLIGYETMDKHISELDRGILEDLGISKESFRIRSMPELSMKGAYRTLLAPFKDLIISGDEDKMRLSFSIPSGAYATVLINEVTKSDDLSLDLLAPRKL